MRDDSVRAGMAEAREAALAQKRILGPGVTVLVVAGLAVGIALEFGLDWGAVDGAGIVAGVLLGAGLCYGGARLYRMRYPVPRCPACNAIWSPFDDQAFKLIERGHCPECHASLL